MCEIWEVLGKKSWSNNIISAYVELLSSNLRLECLYSATSIILDAKALIRTCFAEPRKTAST